MSELGEIGKAKLAEVKKTWGKDAEGPELDALEEYCRLTVEQSRALDHDPSQHSIEHLGVELARLRPRPQ